MRLLLALILFIPLWATDDLPALTDAQRIEVREAQLRTVRAINVQLQIESRIPELQEAKKEVNASQAALTKLVLSLRPADCENCNLEENLTWKRPAPPEPKKEEQP